MQEKQDFFETVIHELVKVRHKAGLTQAQLAERMGTKQAVISRMEHDRCGSMSMHRFVDYALACGYAPLNLVTAQHDLFFQCWYPVFKEANPGVPFTRENLLAWNEHVKRYGTNVPWKP